MPLSNLKTRAIFLDRDGTLNVDHGYVRAIDQLSWLPGAIDALRTCQALGFKLFIVTNQSGIGRGMFTDEAMQSLHEHMTSALRQQGVEIQAIYHCPHAPDDACSCRKPQPRLIAQAATDHGIAMQESYMVGDKVTDATAGERAGCTGVLLGDDAEWHGLRFATLIVFSQWLKNIKT
jgi:D-glycero-D-manno-heptose 1,7-bisphosphate phosphatase